MRTPSTRGGGGEDSHDRGGRTEATDAISRLSLRVLLRERSNHLRCPLPCTRRVVASSYVRGPSVTFR